jgi:MscS family membrane protein
MNSFLEAINTFLNYSFFDISIKNLIIAIVVFSFFIFLRALFTKIVLKTLKQLTQKTKSDIDNKLIEIFEPVLKLVFIIIGFYAAKGILSIEKFDKFANNLGRSLIAFTIFWTLYRSIESFSYIFKKFSLKFNKKISSDIENFIIKTLKIIIIILGAMTIFQEWGFNIGAFVASLGLGGLAFALAAKDTAANLFGSLVVFTDRPFKIGEWIQTPDVEGVVDDIGIRSTKIRTFSQAIVTVPNAVIANSAITNWSRMGKRRIKMRIGLTYSTTRQKLQTILNDIRQMLKNHKDVHQGTIMIYFDKFEDSSLSIFCYFFTTTTVWEEYLKAREDINLKIMKIIEDNEAEFAFPSQSIYIEKMDSKQ